MTERHVASAEDKFVIISVTPDFCRVGKYIVPFDISRKLTPEKANFSTSVFVHDESVLMVDSLIDTVEGDLGNGIQSNTAQSSGNSKIVAGSGTVFVEGRRVARDGDLVEMNGQAAAAANSPPTTSENSDKQSALDHSTGGGSEGQKDGEVRSTSAGSSAKAGTPVEEVFSKANLSQLPTLPIAGAGDKKLAEAMTKLQGERDSETGAWRVNASEQEVERSLDVVATARGVPPETVRKDFQRFVELTQERERAAQQKDPHPTGPFVEGAKGESRVPLLSMVSENGLPDNSKHMGSIDQLRFGKLVGDTLGVDPVFGALLSPTGGIAGAGNKEVGVLAYAAGGGKDVVIPHGIAHDAGGYLLNYHGVGPGYHYVPTSSTHVLDRTNPLAGQVDGTVFFYNLKTYGTPDGPPNGSSNP